MCFSLAAQTYEDAGYDWQKDRKRYEVTGQEEEHQGIILKRYAKAEYAYEDQNNSPFIFRTLHVIMRVNNTDGINRYNKIYIPMKEEGGLLKVKARTISKAGKVTELDEGDILEMSDDENNNKYKAFVLDGLEPGSEIEYLFITKDAFSFYSREYFQSDIPWKDISFELVTPENLVFNWKGYNGLPEAADTTLDEKNRTKVEIPYAPEMEDEDYALYNNNKMRMDYYLAYNRARGNARVYTHASAAQVMFETICKTETSEKKAIDELIKTLKLAAQKPEEKIIKLENYLKTNIAVYTNAPTTDIPSVIKNKYASELGIMRVYAAVLKAVGINYQIVVTCDRDKVKFDPELDSWSYLENYVLYFPDFDKYLAPQEQQMRYGIIPPEWTANHGLFIKRVSMGGIESGLGKVGFIEPLPYDKNFDNIYADITFTNDDRIQLNVKRELGGYNAVQIQPVYPLLTADKQKEISEELLKSLVPDAEFVSVEAKNVELNVNPLQSPFTLVATMKSAVLLERAGNKLLFKVGEVIGPQVEMYQDTERKFDVENDYNRTYYREIKFTIPAGYAVKNLDDLNMAVQHLMNGEKAYAFESSYTVSGSVVSATINEYYKVISCPKSEFQQYRNVINAAADFNKVVLVLEKQ